MTRSSNPLIQRIKWLSTPNLAVLHWSLATAALFGLITAFVFLAGAQPWDGLEVAVVLSLSLAARQSWVYHHTSRVHDVPKQELIP